MHRRLMVSLVLVASFLPSSALAGRVFGDIKLGGKPLAAGVPLKITRVIGEEGKAKPAAAPADTTTTDEFGSYKLTVKEPGKCILTILYEKQALTLEVFSYKEATRYDLIVEKKDGKLTLRRK